MSGIFVGVAEDGDVFLQLPINGNDDAFYIIKLTPSQAMSIGTDLIARSEAGEQIKKNPYLATVECVGSA